MIKIRGDWYYDVDEHQYILIHEYEREKIDIKTKQKTGEITTVKEYVGYYQEMADMLVKLTKLLAREKIKSGEITTIEEHIQVLRTIKNELCDIVMPF